MSFQANNQQKIRLKNSYDRLEQRSSILQRICLFFRTGFVGAGEWFPDDADVRGSRVTKHVPWRPVLWRRVLRLPYMMVHRRAYNNNQKATSFILASRRAHIMEHVANEN
jgi:hypothetical protein